MNTPGDDVPRSRLNRRQLLFAAGGLVAGATTVNRSLADDVAGPDVPALNWGFVGTGMIANSMARVLRSTGKATLAASSSRRMDSAREFADRYRARFAFDDWREMCASPDVDAIYVATPTSVREEIAVFAANAGKHVLAEKPFASADSVKNIIAACELNDVAFMDGTHFVHHPRTAAMKKAIATEAGRPWSVASAFQFSLPDRSNIRYNGTLEPMGAIGDAGWYNMRAAYEFLPEEAKPVSFDALMRRDQETGAAVSGSGLVGFSDGSTTTWNCGFDSGAVVMDLRITGDMGVLSVDNFLSQDADNSASYLFRRGGWGPDALRESRQIESSLSGAALMFEDFAAAAADPALRAQWTSATLHTQMLLDACWAAAKG